MKNKFLFIKTISLTFLFLVGSLFLSINYRGIRNDNLISNGFTYIPFVIITLVVFLFYLIYDYIKNKKYLPLIIYLILFLIILILTIVANYINGLNVNYSFRLFYSLILLILFFYNISAIKEFAKSFDSNFFEE
jgi:hypothetical protein